MIPFANFFEKISAFSFFLYYYWCTIYIILYIYIIAKYIHVINLL